jgi:hypothetical protein
MNAITRRGAAGSMLTAALTSLIVLLAGPAGALTTEHTYLPPFDQVSTDLGGCEAPWCAGEVSANPGGALSADLHVVGAGVGRFDLAAGSVKLTHVVGSPASEISIDVSVHIDAAHATAIGAPLARGVTKIGLDAWPTNAAGSFQYAEAVIAAAEGPIGDTEAEEQDIVISVTLGEGPRVIPAGPIEITVSLVAETTTMPPHAESLGHAEGCAGSCVGVGTVDASISGEARSVTVREIR